MSLNVEKIEVSIEELRAREPHLDSANFPETGSSSIVTTVLLEGDLTRLLRDYYTSGDLNNYNLWVDAIQKKIAESLLFSFLDLIAADHIKTTTIIKFDRD